MGFAQLNTVFQRLSSRLSVCVHVQVGLLSPSISIHPAPLQQTDAISFSLLRLGVQVLLQRHAKLLAQGLELLEVLVVLPLVLNLGLDALEDADGGGEVVNPPGGLEGSSDDRGGGDKVVGEGVVEVALTDVSF